MVEASATQVRQAPADNVMPALDVDVSTVIAQAMRGQWTYEQNVHAVLTGRRPSPEQSELVRMLLIALSACPGSRDDLTLVRLCASTGSSLADAVRPVFAGYDNARQSVSFRLSGAATAAAVATMRKRCEDCLGRLAAHREMAGPDERAAADALDRLCCEMLAYLDIDAALLPAFKIVARMPVLAKAFLEERRAWPNRYVGLSLTALPDGRDVDAAERALKMLLTSASFIDLITEAMAGRRTVGRERSLVHAALVAGMPPVGAAASSMVITLLSMRGATFVEAFQGLLSTFGYYHLGALPACASMLWRMQERGGPLDVMIDEELASSVWHLGGEHKGVRRVPGFGHRFYKADPRASALLGICKRTITGPYIDLIAQLNETLQQRHVGHVNMDGIGAAMGLHFGFSPLVASGLTLISRVFGVAALYQSIGADSRDCQLLTKSPKVLREETLR